MRGGDGCDAVRVSRACLLAGVITAVVVAGCGAKPAPPNGPAGPPEKPADFVGVFTWSQGVPAGARPVSAVFHGPHFAYGFGALAVRAELDASSGGLESGPGRAAAGHEFLVLYRLQADDSFAPPPTTPLGVDVVVGGARKRLPKPLDRGTGLVVSVPVGQDATLEVTDDKPYTFSVRDSANATAPSSADNAPAKPSSTTRVTWQDGTYQADGTYQGQRTSGPLSVTLDLGKRGELAAALPGIGTAPAKQLWLRLPDARITAGDAAVELDLTRSVTLSVTAGKPASARQSTTGLLFAVPDTFTGGALTVAPVFPAGSTAKWSAKPATKQLQLTRG